MPRNIAYLYQYFIIIFSIRLFTSLGAQTASISPQIPDSLKNTYHLGWVWPDSLPKLTPNLTIDSTGRIYVIDEKGTLYCLEDDGKIIWTYHVGYSDAGFLALGNQALYYLVTINEGNPNKAELHSLAFNGKPLWIFETDKRVSPTNPIISPCGQIYFETINEYCVNGAYLLTKSGEGKYLEWSDDERWRKLIGFNSKDELIVWIDNLKLLVSLSNKGDFIKSFPDSLRCLKNAVISQKDNRIYAISSENKNLIINNLICLNSNDFSVIWHYQIIGDVIFPR